MSMVRQNVPPNSLVWEGGPGRRVRILGFGACMVAGAPHTKDESFVAIAAQKLRDQSGGYCYQQCTVELSFASFGGFPAQRSVRQLSKALIRTQPDIVVVQLGSTDAIIDLEHRVRARLSRVLRKQSAPTQASGPILPGTYRATWKRAVKDVVKAVLCRVLGVTPRHGGAKNFNPAIDEVVRLIEAAGAVPVLVTPFPQADTASNRFVRMYREKMYSLSGYTTAEIADAYSVLVYRDKSEYLMTDRMHLTRYGHRVVGNMLGNTLLTVVRSHQLHGRSSV